MGGGIAGRELERDYFADSATLVVGGSSICLKSTGLRSGVTFGGWFLDSAMCLRMAKTM